MTWIGWALSEGPALLSRGRVESRSAVRTEPSARVRVLQVTPYFAPAFGYGGPPRSLLGLCRGLQRAGVELEVVTTTANGLLDLPASPPDGTRYAGVAVHYLPRAFPRRLFGAVGLNAALAARVGRYALVHIHGLWHLPGWAAAHQARRVGVPYVVSPRGMLDPGSLAHHAVRKRVAYWMGERRKLAGAALLHATSAAEAGALERRGLGVPIVIQPNGVEVWEDKPPRGVFRRRLGLAAGAPLFVFLGRLHSIKRLDLLAAAFERVRGVHPEAHLAIAGPDEGCHRRHAEPWFARSRPAVHWTGELDEREKWSLLTDADALVMCSDSESFGMSVVEALAVGVPVVVTRTCPWPEIEASGCGYWVPQTAEAIAAGLLHLLRDPAGGQVMGARGKELVRAKYSWDSIAHAMADQYHAITAVEPRRGTVP